jgi:hypothetical protein
VYKNCFVFLLEQHLLVCEHPSFSAGTVHFPPPCMFCKQSVWQKTTYRHRDNKNFALTRARQLHIVFYANPFEKIDALTLLTRNGGDFCFDLHCITGHTWTLRRRWFTNTQGRTPTTILIVGNDDLTTCGWCLLLLHFVKRRKLAWRLLQRSRGKPLVPDVLNWFSGVMCESGGFSNGGRDFLWRRWWSAVDSDFA